MKAMLASLVCYLPAIAVAADGSLLTVAETSEFRATATHAEVVKLCEGLARASDRIILDELGTSHEGRSLPLLLVADPPVADAEQARQGGKLIVFLFGNIHAGEVCGKEALLMLARELATQEEPGLLDDLVIAIAPIFNADGNERFAKDNRPGQVGPRNGMGVRHNAQGLDLNRDWVKLQSPEARALVGFLGRWDPAMIIDTHTTNGSRHRYVLTYQGPKHPGGDDRIIEFVRDRMLPAVSENLRDASGIATFFYGNFRDKNSRWETYPCLARYGTPYRGLRNRLAILSEAYSYATYRQRVEGTLAFVKGCLDYARQHRREIEEMIARVDADTIAAGRAPAEDDLVAIRSRVEPFEKSVTVLGYEPPVPGRDSEAAPSPRDYTVSFVNDFLAAESVRRPFAYLVPASQHEVLGNLGAHGVELQMLREDRRLDVESYVIRNVRRAERSFQGRRLVNVEVESRSGEVDVPAGTVLVRSAQRLGSLLVTLLEPRSEDGLVTWGFFDGSLRVGETFPVRRLNAPVELLTSTYGIAASARVEEKRPITYAALYGGGERPDLEGSPLRVRGWTADGEEYLFARDGRLRCVEAESGVERDFHDVDRMAAALARIPVIDEETAKRIATRTSFRMDAGRTGALIEHERDLYWARFDGSVAVRLTSTPEREELAKPSPDGRFVAFVRDNDLWVVDVATRTERAMTTGGSDVLRNGKADWVYFEEVFDRDWNAYWWSPTSRHIVFLRTDSSDVPDFTIVDDVPEPQYIETVRYPKAGDPNPRVDIGIVSVAGGAARWVDLSAYDPASFLVTGVGFRPDGETVCFYGQNRIQTWLDVCAVSVRGGKPDVLLRETTKAWVKIPPAPRFLADGSFLLQSERSGWQHVYHFEKDGKLRGAVTSGNWEVRRVHQVDETGGWVYVSGTKDSPVAENLYRAKLDGSAVERLTPDDGSHSVTVAPTSFRFVDSWSRLDRPVRVELRGPEGKLLRTLDTNPVADLEKWEVLIPEYLEIETTDGFHLPATLLKPPGFDPGREYPVWFMTYAGPHAPTVRDSWSSGGGRTWDQALANEGIVIFRCDPRSASGRGAQSAWTAYRRLGIQELEDITEAIRWLKKKPWIDGARIGMGGYSYGGFMTAYAMTHSDLFAAGFSGAPVTDWKDYDSIYTERYMSTPQDNPEGYAKSSVVAAAANLRGNLLLVHGTMDDNVHVQNTIRLVAALQRAKKSFRFMIYPGSRHGIWASHLRGMRYEFILENLRPRRLLEAEPAGARRTF